MRSWYATYLSLPHWRNLRTQKLEQAGYRCERCGEYGRRSYGGSLPNLHVHHRTYERRGRERLGDLEVLCSFCHAVEHGRAAAGDERARERFRRRHVDSIINRDDGWWIDDVDLEVAEWDKIIEEAGF